MTSISLLRAVRMINTVSGRPVRMARARSDSVGVGQPQIQEDDPGPVSWTWMRPEPAVRHKVVG